MAKRASGSISIWYPRYPGDYGRKTAHLSLVEHGVYALLMDYAYSNDGIIPANAVQVHRICRAFAGEEQDACMRVLHEFFDLREDGWHNERVDEEMLKRGNISEKRAKAALKRHANARANAGANAHTTTATATYSGGGGSAGAERAGINIENINNDRTEREMVLDAIGVPDGVVGASKFIGTPGDVAEMGRWLALPGITIDLACSEIRRVMANKTDGPPSSFKYFSKAMERLSGQMSAPALQPSEGRKQSDKPSTAKTERAIIDAASSVPDDYFRDPGNRDRL